MYVGSVGNLTPIRVAAASGALTSAHHNAVDFTACLAYIMRGFIRDELKKEDVCRSDFVDEKLRSYFKFYSYGKHYEKTVLSWPNRIKSTEDVEEVSAHVVFSRAISAFCSTNSFEDGLRAVYETGLALSAVGAVYGQLAGSWYGISALEALPDFRSIRHVDDIKKLTNIMWSIVSTDDRAAEEDRKKLLVNGRVKDLNQISL
jgi:ADP-ribosylglycohydrolase